MDIRGYRTGPIQAEAAFTSDFSIPEDIPLQRLTDMIEIERRSMDVWPGMRHKYVPLRFDPATGARQVGGRYLFDAWENALLYDRFTSTEVAFEPGGEFWDRPFFLNVDRHDWRVAGAHDFTPMATTHHVNRLERWTYRYGDATSVLAAVWPAVRANAKAQGLASVWLMFQQEERQIGILTVATRLPDDDLDEATSRALTRLERIESVGRFLPGELGAEKVFDRTSLILTTWLPQSRLAGGDPAAFPVSPPMPLPQVAPQARLRKPPGPCARLPSIIESSCGRAESRDRYRLTAEFRDGRQACFPMLYTVNIVDRTPISGLPGHIIRPLI
jgi:hypothetical protein